ncbi:hypothetical protein SETIT_6G195900v2 [Setaria italica]|uniref:Uncharacterized protein n=2 Tax=Setaria TaxID=4554 RepID=A0A368RNH4_SETIT|nr:hypothetical protein SETIT_6G195900v2 [Setaria italica]TKW10963.1 hypothetical protein SEVIR_6G203300v2 [Setaria viridis]
MAGGGGVSEWERSIFDCFESSVVRLRVPCGGAGNGFVVFGRGNTRLIMTCEHVVHGLPLGTRNIMVSRSEPYLTAQSTPATLLFVDEARDLALLRVDAVQWDPCNVLAFFEAAPTSPGMDVVLLSFFHMGPLIVLRPGTFAGKIIGPHRLLVLGTLNVKLFAPTTQLSREHIRCTFPTIKAALRGWLRIADVRVTNLVITVQNYI